MSTNRKYKAAAIAVLAKLKDRRGFEWWWHDIDEETKQEIRDEIAETLAKKLKAKGIDVHRED